MTPYVICLIFKNESLYIREWIEFNIIQGVSKLYLYDNNSTDDFLPILQPYIDRGIVDLAPWPYPNPSQFLCYSHCISRLRGQDVFCAFADGDEFLWSPKYDTVTEALNSFPKEWGCIAANWVCFGSGGQQSYSPEPVIERFTLRGSQSDPVNLHIKSIVRMDRNVHVGGTPHNFNVEHGTFSETGEQLSGPFTSTHSSDIIRINHYSSKSKEEWIKRVNLGKPDRPGLQIDWSWYTDRQGVDVDDREIQRFLPELKRRLNA